MTTGHEPGTTFAALRPHRGGFPALGGAVGRDPADACGHVTDAGAPARAGPAGRPAAPPRPDLRPVRGAGAAVVLPPRSAAAGQDRGAAAGARHVGGAAGEAPGGSGAAGAQPAP